MPKCSVCDSTDKLTRHHVGKGETKKLCEIHHRLIHNSEEVAIVKNAVRRIKRARLRIIRDLEIIADSEKLLEKTSNEKAE